MVLAFGDHRLDIERRELRRGTELIDLEPKVFDLLAFLVQHRDRVVSKDDLLQGVWGGRIVSESALTTRINAVRRALGDDGAAQRLVRTFTRKGIRFVGEVKEISDPGTQAASDPLSQALATAGKPSIAVLPFANISGDREQEYFADGMVEEIITALSRIRWLFVIARNSSFTYKGQLVDVKRVGRELGVRYVLEGSVRKAGSRVRITAQLIEAETGAHLWADRFDGSLEDVFDLQDKVASSVAGVIEPALQAAETARSTARPTADLTAYDLCLRAQPLFWSLGKQGICQALALLEEAIACDPQYGPALGWAAMCRLHMDINGWSEDPERNRLSGVDYARRALVADQEDAATLANAAYVLANFGEDIDTMLGIVDRALALNPSFARGWTLSGNMKIWAGDPDAAIERLETSLRLSPRARVSQPFILGMAYFYKRQFDQAAQYLRTAIQEQPGSAPVHRVLAACYAHMGRLAESRDLIERLRAMGAVIEPNRSVSVHRNVEYQELFLSGLRLAAGEGT
jgi:TolB-like protein